MNQSSKNRWNLFSDIDKLFKSPLVGILFLMPLILFLATLNLGSYPTISGWDEGMYLQTASNLVRYGEYATRNGDVFDRLMPPGGTGATLIAPVALALWLSNDSLVAARLVITAYLLITLISVYLLVRCIGGWFAGFSSIPLFLTAGCMPFDTLSLGRQVLAEIPAFAFMLLGLWVWLNSWHRGLRWLTASSVLMALAVITKNQLIWILLPSFALFYLINRVYYRHLLWTYSLIPLVGIVLGYGAWFVFSLWIVGPSGLANYLESLQAITAASYFHLNWRTWLANLKLFYKSQQYLIVMIAIAYGFYCSRRRTLIGLSRLVLPLFASVALVSFLTISRQQWPRYIYPALALSALCTALLIGDLVKYFYMRHSSFKTWRSFAVLVLAISLLTGSSLVRDLHLIMRTHDASAALFAKLVDQRVPENTKILNWEWEVEFYSHRSFVHPPSRLFSALLNSSYHKQHSEQILRERRIPTETQYLIVGPFARGWVFDSALAQRPHRLLCKEGSYELYQLDR